MNDLTSNVLSSKEKGVRERENKQGDMGKYQLHSHEGIVDSDFNKTDDVTLTDDDFNLKTYFVGYDTIEDHHGGSP